MLQREPWCKSIDEIKRMTPGMVRILTRYENERNEKLAQATKAAGPIGRNSGRPMPELSGHMPIAFPPSSGSTHF